MYPNDEVYLSPEEAELFREACVDPAVQINRLLDDQFGNYKNSAKRKIKAVEEIAKSTKSQAESISEEVLVLKDQLAFAKSEAESAKKDACFSKVISIISITVSIGSLIAATVALM